MTLLDKLHKMTDSQVIDYLSSMLKKCKDREKSFTIVSLLQLFKEGSCNRMKLADEIKKIRKT